MQVAGIIAEYNPFHAGHQYLLSRAKENADAVVVAMSGNFTQRAEPALLSDRYRAKMALLCGADLVFQLPLPFAIASAKNFALGGVSLLDATKVVDTLYFGSECADVKVLQQLSAHLQSKETDVLLQTYLQQGISYPTARTHAVRALYGDAMAKHLENPNDILAIEYLQALQALSSTIQPVAVKRRGAAHDAQQAQDGFASASFLRERMKQKQSIADFMPPKANLVLQEALQAKAAPSDYQKLDLAVLTFLRTAGKEQIKTAPDVREGIENRILTAAKTAASLEELFTLAKSKRYTHARIRRIVLSAFLGVQKEMAKGGVPYLKLLGATPKGISLLKEIEKNTALPILKRAADHKKLEGRGKALFDLECRATDIYNLTLPKIRPAGTEMTDSAVFLQDF